MHEKTNSVAGCPSGLLRLGRVFLACALLSVTAYNDAYAQFASGLQGASGSTVGPDGAIYVTEGLMGQVSRIDPVTGVVTSFAQGLPPSLIGIGGAIDLAFLDGQAYVLVTLVGFPFGSHVDGIYRVDSPTEFTVIADIGTYAARNPPQTTFALPQGVQYSIETHRGGFLVADGHHNRVLRVGLDGAVSQEIIFGNIVPTGLETWGDTVFVAQAGAIPHAPEDGKVVAFEVHSGHVTEIASGAPLLVDVERGRGGTLFALAQGHWTPGQMDGAPADPDTGSLVRVNKDGTFDTVAEGINLPTSMQVIGNAAYVITLTGEVWKFDGLAAPPFGKSH